MSDAANLPPLYRELAEWWPLVSRPEDYEQEAAFFATLLNDAAIPVRAVLELGSGGGNNASHLKASFAMTLVDLSEDMLAVSRQLNPDCDHRPGDMRSVRLGQTFDAVFIHDAIDYMMTEDDLRRAIETAFVHCRLGGVAIFVPDHLKDNFEETSEHGGSDGADGRGVRFLAWTWDPDPRDSSVVAEYAFLLRERDGTVSVLHETHQFGLFGRADWLRLLADAGFAARAVTEVTSDERVPREVFVGRRDVGN